MKLTTYFLKVSTSQKLPRLPRMYATDYDAADLEVSEARLMTLTAIRSPQGVRILERRTGLTSDDLAASLPVKRKWKRRGLMPVVRRLLGLNAYDPMRRIYFQHRKR